MEAVHPDMKPYKNASLEFSADLTRVPMGDTELGGWYSRWMLLDTSL